MDSALYISWQKTLKFVKGKTITNFPISETGKGPFLSSSGSFFKKKVCTFHSKKLYAICTLVPCAGPSDRIFSVNSETDFQEKNSFLRIRILKDSLNLRLIRYEKGQNRAVFFYAKINSLRTGSTGMELKTLP